MCQQEISDKSLVYSWQIQIQKQKLVFKSNNENKLKFKNQEKMVLFEKIGVAKEPFINAVTSWIMGKFLLISHRNIWNWYMTLL